MAEADKAGEFVARSAREEMRRLFSFCTMLGRVQHAVATDPYTYYLRTAQGWFFLAVGSLGATVIAIAHVLSG